MVSIPITLSLFWKIILFAALHNGKGPETNFSPKNLSNIVLRLFRKRRMTLGTCYHNFSTPLRYANLYAAGGKYKKTMCVSFIISRFQACFPLDEFFALGWEAAGYFPLHPKIGAVFLTSLKRVFRHHPKDRYQK